MPDPFWNGERINVVSGQLAGSSGAVIVDRRTDNHHGVPYDLIWVRLDSGENPQFFHAAELERESDA